jgi:hypothetical protein
MEDIEKLAKELAAARQRRELLEQQLRERSGDERVRSLEKVKCRQEKEVVMTSLEMNEEFITNTLQKEISRLMNNKKELEALLSQEQIVILNSLCQKVSQQISEKL